MNLLGDYSSSSEDESNKIEKSPIRENKKSSLPSAEELMKTIDRPDFVKIKRHNKEIDTFKIENRRRKLDSDPDKIVYKNTHPDDLDQEKNNKFLSEQQFKEEEEMQKALSKYDVDDVQPKKSIRLVDFEDEY